MNTYRNDPDGEANQQATRESERYIGGLKLQAALEPKQLVIEQLAPLTRKATFTCWLA